VLTAASDEDGGVTSGEDVENECEHADAVGDGHGVAAVVMVSRSFGHGFAAWVHWSAASQRGEELPAGDHRDELPRRGDRAKAARDG